MSNEWFQCSVRFDKTMETGLIKKVTEVFLVEALSYTEAEKRIIEEMTPFISGEFEVSDIKRARLAEIFESKDAAADRWYKAKLAFVTVDEKTGGEKLTTTQILVQATDFNNAVKSIDDQMEGTLADYLIVSVAETKIIDIYHYEQKKEENAS